MRSLLRIGAILGKEVRQLSRDRLTFGMIIGIPLMQVLLFGYAINLDVRHLRAGVADQAGTQLSRQLVADAEATQVIEVVYQVRTAADLEDLLRRGEITIGILIPPDFERRVRDYMVVDPRLDHSFRIPTPDLSIKLGTPNACNDCHADKDARWSLQWLRSGTDSIGATSPTTARPSTRVERACPARRSSWRNWRAMLRPQRSPGRRR